MKKELKVFRNEMFGKVRVVAVNGAPWFSAKDVCEMFGYIWNGLGSVRRIPEEWRGLTTVETPLGPQGIYLLSKEGLYYYLDGTNNPAAQPFRKWIVEEVIPSVRKTCPYVLPYPPIPEGCPDFTNPPVIAKAWAEQYERARLAEKAEDGHKKNNNVYFSFRRMNALFPFGNFKNTYLLWKVSKNLGLPIIDMYDANFGHVKTYHIDVWCRAYNLDKDDILDGCSKEGNS